MQTIVAEVYGPNYERQIEIAQNIRDIFTDTDGVVDDFSGYKACFEMGVTEAGSESASGPRGRWQRGRKARTVGAMSAVVASLGNNATD